MNFHWKTQLLFYFEQKSDFVKLGLDENLREHDRVISPARVTGAFEISGKTTGLPTGNKLKGYLG